MPNPAEGVDFLPLHNFSWQGQVGEFTITPHPDVAAASLQPDYEYLIIFIDLHGPTNGKTCSRSVSFSAEGDLLLKVDLEEDDRRKFEGVGLLSGSFPLSMVTQEGNLPSQAEVRILYRPNTGGLGDGTLVATTTCNADSTWQVSGLNENLKYDIVARILGFNDVLISDVQPVTP